MHKSFCDRKKIVKCFYINKIINSNCFEILSRYPFTLLSFQFTCHFEIKSDKSLFITVKVIENDNNTS